MKVVKLTSEAKRLRRERINDYLHYGAYNDSLSHIKKYVRRMEDADGFYHFMPYKEYVKEIETSKHDKITFFIICELIANDKFKQAAIKACDNYTCEETAEEAIYQAFEYLQNEKDYFPAKTKEYFRDDITLAILAKLY